MSLKSVENPQYESDDRSRETYARYLIWLPALWVLGIHIIVFIGMMLAFAWRRWPLSPAANIIFAAWTLVSVMQGLSALHNWSVAGLPLSSLPGRLLSTTVIGWLFLGLAIAVGCGARVGGSAATRGVMILALHIVLFGIIAYGIALASGAESLTLQTPLRALLGSGSAADFYTLARFYVVEDGLVRIILFFPWPTALSLAGICIILISTCEDSLRWRIIGYVGGLFAVVFSFSRMGAVALPVALSIPILIRSPPVLVLAGLALATFAGFASALQDLNLIGMVAQLREALHGSRAGSSVARDLIYEESWRGFLQSPVFGWGWVGPSVIAEEYLPIGSHSTFYGTLYTGGLITFVPLVMAWALTLGVLLHRAASRPDAHAAAALGIFATISLFAYGESIYSVVFPLLFALLFLGGALEDPRQEGRMLI
jgi:hypothetical protein